MALIGGHCLLFELISFEWNNVKFSWRGFKTYSDPPTYFEGVMIDPSGSPTFEYCPFKMSLKRTIWASQAYGSRSGQEVGGLCPDRLCFCPQADPGVAYVRPTGHPHPVCQKFAYADGQFIYSRTSGTRSSFLRDTFQLFQGRASAPTPCQWRPYGIWYIFLHGCMR